jgi:Sulfotransferase family
MGAPLASTPAAYRPRARIIIGVLNATGPSFLVIGAMKAGTSSVYRYLGQHPDVFVSANKEPGFFAYENGRLQWSGPHDQQWRAGLRPVRWEQYLDHFSAARGQSAVGEATPLYLCDPLAPERIRHYLPAARLIAILRHPVDRAYSAFLMKCRRDERLSFVDALAAESRRIAEGWGYGWHYAALGLYVEPLRRYRSLFSLEQLEVVLYDDLADDPGALMRRLYRHLGVDEAFEPDVRARYQSAHLTRWRAFDAWMASHLTVRARLKRYLPGDTPRRLYSFVNRLNQRLNRRPAPQLSPELRAQLAVGFRDEILTLQDLLGRDLSHWLAD